ncbi:UNVERIFIED_CONTAM: hypothetical protein FKN15_052162 [Acipenser sinensis]
MRGRKSWLLHYSCRPGRRQPSSRRPEQSHKHHGLAQRPSLLIMEEPFKEVIKKKRLKQKDVELPDGRAQPMLAGRQQDPAGVPVPPSTEEEESRAGGDPGVVQDFLLAESQSPEIVTAVAREMEEEAAETGVTEPEGAAEELIPGRGQRGKDGGGALSDIPDRQHASRNKLYTLEQVNNFMKETKGRRG